MPRSASSSRPTTKLGTSLALSPGFQTGSRNIIVVDDVSSDGTCDVVRAIDDPRITLVCHEANTGVGGAMVSGYKKGLELGAEIIVKMDADGQMDPADLPASSPHLPTGWRNTRRTTVSTS